MGGVFGWGNQILFLLACSMPLIMPNSAPMDGKNPLGKYTMKFKRTVPKDNPDTASKTMEIGSMMWRGYTVLLTACSGAWYNVQ